MNENGNISSIVVRISPGYVDKVLESLNNSDLCEVHFHDKLGRIVITIEGENVDVELEKMRAIQSMDHVLSAELVYSYNEEELSDARELLNSAEDPVPPAMDEDHPDASTVQYGGRLKM